MKIVFLTLDRFFNINDREISEDLIRKFKKEGHEVYIIAPRERRYNMITSLTKQDGVHILGVKTLNIQKTSIIEKGFATIMIEKQFKTAIKKYLKNINFDLILYTTPPITFTNIVKYLKKNNPRAKSYLLLKDIFPQNAVDIEIFGKNSLFNKYFRIKEVSLYKNSDYIGCMSPANVKFLLNHNNFIDRETVEVAPNSIELTGQISLSKDEKQEMRRKYNLPHNKQIFIYGGNLGKPQGVPFLIQCLNANKDREDCHFLIIGNGTEYNKLNNWHKQARPKSVSLYQRLPKADYDFLVQCCDIGLIFLDYRFTIPNFPSRLLSYLEYKIPIVAVTDENSDMGSIATENGFGMWVPSNNVDEFTKCVNTILASDIKSMGEKGYQYLKQNYTTNNTYNIIMSHFNHV